MAAVQLRSHRDRQPSRCSVPHQLLFLTLVCAFVVQISSRANVVSIFEIVDQVVTDGSTITSKAADDDFDDNDDGMTAHNEDIAGENVDVIGMTTNNQRSESAVIGERRQANARAKIAQRWPKKKKSDKYPAVRPARLDSNIRLYGRPRKKDMPWDSLSRKRQWTVLSTETCLYQGEPDIPAGSWHLRAPSFILLGHHKCGTQAMTQYLWQHPKILANSRLEMGTLINQAEKFVSTKGIHRRAGRDLYMNAFDKEIPNNMTNRFKSDSSDSIMFETFPRYFLDSDKSPAMILCLAPWVKLIVIFRDPVERIISHYNYANEARTKNRSGKLPSYKEWIDDDLASLEKAGVIGNRTKEELDAFSGSEAEASAWKNYTRTPNSQFLVGRGLYSIQLRLWYAAMDEIGKSRNDLLVLRSEDIKADTQGEYSKLLQFLGLEDHLLADSEAKHTTNKDHHIDMPELDRSEMEQFYKPYNKQLSILLGKQWDRVWDY